MAGQSVESFPSVLGCTVAFPVKLRKTVQKVARFVPIWAAVTVHTLAPHESKELAMV